MASGECDDRDVGGGESTTNGRIESSDRDAARGSGRGTDREADTVPIVDEAAGGVARSEGTAVEPTVVG
jgi:hypothetical protein